MDSAGASETLRRALSVAGAPPRAQQRRQTSHDHAAARAGDRGRVRGATLSAREIKRVLRDSVLCTSTNLVRDEIKRVPSGLLDKYSYLEDHQRRSLR